MRQHLLASLSLVLLAACSSSDDAAAPSDGANLGGAAGTAGHEAAGGSPHREVILGAEAGGGGKTGSTGGAAGSGAGAAGGAAAGGGTGEEPPGFSLASDPSEEDDLADDGVGHDEDDLAVAPATIDPTQPSDYEYDNCNYDSDTCEAPVAGMGTPADPNDPYADQMGWDTAEVAETSDGEDGADVAADYEAEDPATVDDEPSSDDPETGLPPAPTPPPPGLPPGVKPFWHIARPHAAELEMEPGSLHKGKRWWLVSNSAKPTFLVGVNSVMAPDSDSKPCAGIDSYVFRDTSKDNLDQARLDANASAEWTRLTSMGFNSVAAWSHVKNVPYSVVLNVSPDKASYSLKNATGTVLQGGTSGKIAVGDPYNPGFIAQLQAMAAKDVATRANDPNLQMYFAGNELGIFDLAKNKGRGGLRDFRRWLWSDCPAGSTLDAPQCTPHALGLHLRHQYKSSIADLNKSWKSSYTSFEQVVTDPAKRPVPFTDTCDDSGQCGADLQEFVHDDLLRQWALKVVKVIKAADPNHLVSSPRLAVASPRAYRFWRVADQHNPDIWADDYQLAHPHHIPFGGQKLKYNPWPLLKAFDVVSINIYVGSARFNRSWLNYGLKRIRKYTGLPINISEFSVRAKIPGWTNRGGANSFVHEVGITQDQRRRASHFKSQMRQFLGYPFVIGASWHAWTDRYHKDIPAKQINMGLVQCEVPKLKDSAHPAFPGVATQAGHRWEDMTSIMTPFNKGIMAGLIKRAQH